MQCKAEFLTKQVFPKFFTTVNDSIAARALQVALKVKVYTNDFKLFLVWERGSSFVLKLKPRLGTAPTQ